MSLAVLVAAGQAQLAQAGVTPPDRSPQYVPGQLLVRFNSAGQTSAAQIHAQAGATVARDYTLVSGLQLVQLQPGVKLEQALAAYRSNPAVLYAEPNYIRHTLDDPNDVYFHDLWSLHNTGQLISFPYDPSRPPVNGKPGADIHAAEAWAITTGSSNVVVGVIDTGVDYNHEDLAANIYCAGSTCHGMNVLNNTADPMDDVFHGTHVAGTIGAVGNNGIGVTGVNWQVKILACKFLDWNGGTDAGAIACLDYIAQAKDSGINIIATNNSWGGYGYSQALYDAIDAQRQRGILFIAAAGNDTNDNDGLYPVYPASFALSNIIAVAATSYDDTLTNFSNFGAHTVHIAAPGERIMSTTPSNTYGVYSGTSMATPHVTGVAALLKAQDPTRDWKTIRNLILAGGDKLPTLSATVTQARLNAYRSLTCQNQSVSTRLQPAADYVLANAGEPLQLAELSINCATPAGAGQVTVSPGGAAAVTLSDNGAAPDQDANDGIYTGQWTPPQAGIYTLTFPVGPALTVAADPYAFSSAPFQYRSFTGTNLNLQDGDLVWIDSPFTLSFGGGAYEGVAVSDDGFLSFDSYAPAQGHKLPYQHALTLLAPFWDDLAPTTAGGNVFWRVTGSAPNRELVIEWRGMGHAGCKLDGSETVTFQVVFPENSTDVLFNYQKTAFGGTCTANDRGAQASIGVQAAPAVAKQYSFQTASLQDKTALVWHATLAPNAVPTITTVFPSSLYADIFDGFVQVTGTNFGNSAVLLVNGAPRPSFVFTPTQMFALVSAADLKTAGTLQLSVFNGLPGGGPSAPFAITVSADDFTVTTASPSVSVRAGSSAVVAVLVDGNPVFYDGVSLACAGLPANATCSFDPARVLAGSYSNLTISVKAAAAAPPAPVQAGRRGTAPLWGFFVVSGILGGGALGGRKRALLALLAVLLVIAMYAGCAGGAGGRTTTGNGTAVQVTPSAAQTGAYTVQINATSGAITHSMSLTLNITQ